MSPEDKTALVTGNVYLGNRTFWPRTAVLMVNWVPETQPTWWLRLLLPPQSALLFSASVYEHVVIFCGVFLKGYLIRHQLFALVLASSL